MQNHLIYELRNARMDEYLTLRLADIISAYRPHDSPLTDKELKAQFGKPFDRIPSTSMKEIVNQAKELPVENYH